MRADTLLALVPRVMERLATMKKGPVHKCLPVGLALAVHLLVFTQASLAADIDCRSDSGIPSGVIAPIDVDHLRKSLADAGFTVGGFYLGETFGNAGGIHQSETYDGVLWTYLLGDLHKAGLWKGLCLYADSYQIHGRSITLDNTGSLVTISNYEALPSTRLSELWLEQHLFNDHVTVRVGQLTADTEFLLSSGGSNFLDSTWGWATLASFNLPGEGPSYPLSTPGVRIALKPNEKWSLMLGVYNGDPAGEHCTGNPQICDNNGLDFRLDSPPFLIAEGSYKYNQDGQLPGTIKLGGWNQFGMLHEQPLGPGVTVAITPNSVPIGTDWAIYAIVDQLVWRVPNSKDPKGIGVFGRVFGGPTEQKLVDFYADGGVTFSGMIPHRADDTLAAGFAYTGLSDNPHGPDETEGFPSARNFEALLEICYTAQLKTGWTLQPDFQYIWHPGGGVPEPSGKGTVPSAAVWGLRTTINF
jgi:porin